MRVQCVKQCTCFKIPRFMEGLAQEEERRRRRMRKRRTGRARAVNEVQEEE